jgi:hypothetical protein
MHEGDEDVIRRDWQLKQLPASEDPEFHGSILGHARAKVEKLLGHVDRQR